jgi:hypothetical protein
LKSFFLWGFKENIGLVFMWVVKDTTTNWLLEWNLPFIAILKHWNLLLKYIFVLRIEWRSIGSFFSVEMVERNIKWST